MAEKGLTKSVSLAVEKTRELRIQRLRMMLDGKLDNPFMVIDQLMAEMADGDPQVELWEKYHAAAIRDGREAQVADAYQKAVVGPRMKRMSADAQAAVLMHAADFFQGIRGDADGADAMLQRVVAVVPSHEEAFGRLERRLEKLMDDKRLVELFAGAASSPPRPPPVLATQALHRLVKLTTPSPVVSDDACRKLVALVPANPKLLDAIDAHCKATKRAALAADAYELAIANDTTASAAVMKARRHRAVELYFGDANAPAKAIDHVEKLLEQDPHDAAAFRAGEKLMSQRDVSSRATSALQKARRARAG